MPTPVHVAQEMGAGLGQRKVLLRSMSERRKTGIVTMTDLFDDLPTTAEPVNWTPDRDSGLARLKTFLPRAGRAYAGTRNFDLGADDRSNVSALSPWLRHRLITETEVLTAVLSKHGYNAAEKFIQEVFWRGYFKGWLQHRPAVWDRYRDDAIALIEEIETNPNLRAQYERATTGNTGIACFDQWVQDLIDTGYLHNHARMWFASIWIFTLKLPWQLGADFFSRHLLDWDPASNTLSWRWVGGLHTVGKTYLARADNIAKYTGGRFNPTGQLVTDATTLEADHLPAPEPLADIPAAPDGSPPGILLITEEDVHVDADVLGELDIRGVVGLGAAAGRSVYPVFDSALAFAQNAIASGVAQTLNVCGEVPSKVLATADWGDALSRFADQCGARRIITADIPTGPSADAMAMARPRLLHAGLELNLFRRRYDQVVWPHAKKGFFGLKKQIPTVLSTLGI